MLAATLITKHGRDGSRWKRRSDTPRLPVVGGSDCRRGMLAVCADLDLPRLDLFRLGESQVQDTVLELRRGSVGFQTIGQRERSGEPATLDLLDHERSFV